MMLGDQSSNHRPKVMPKPDVQLMCENCCRFTMHTFAGIEEVDKKTTDLVYECLKCAAHRVFGREGGTTDDEDDDDEKDGDDE